MIMKLDFNHYVEQIDEILSNSKPRTDRGKALNIAIAFETNMLCEYMKQIAEHANSTHDERLLEICKSICIVEEKRWNEGEENEA